MFKIKDFSEPGAKLTCSPVSQYKFGSSDRYIVGKSTDYGS
jgi:hypothetical protein